MNLAAMLDMAFQLLAFFILTFRPTPIEGQLAMHMPPPVPLTNVMVATPAGGGGGGGQIGFEVIQMFVTSDAAGEIQEVKLYERTIAQGQLDANELQKIGVEIKSVVDLGAGTEGIQIAVDGQLRYGGLMSLIQVCSEQKLPDGTPLKVGFAEQEAGSGQ